MVLLTNYNSVDQTKENVTGTACSTHWEKRKTEVWWGNLQERDKDLGVYMTIILKRIFEKYDGGEEWLHLAQVGTKGGRV